MEHSRLAIDVAIRKFALPQRVEAPDLDVSVKSGEKRPHGHPAGTIGGGHREQLAQAWNDWPIDLLNRQRIGNQEKTGMAQNSSETGMESKPGNLEATKDAAREEANRLARGAKELARDASERGSELVEDVLDTGRSYATRARSEAERVYEVGQKRAEEAAFYAELGYEEAADMIRRHPVQAMGLAVGVGVLIGLLITRR